MNFKKIAKIFFILTGIIVSLFLILVIIVFLNPPKTPEKQTNQPKQYELPIENNYFLGSSNPIVTINLFSDFSCPSCKSTYLSLKNIFIKNPSTVKIVHRDFPTISEDSITLSLIAHCGGEQKAFWETYDYLYKNQGKINTQNLDSIADSLGLQQKQFTACVSSEKYINDIKKDYLLAEKLEVKGTPTLFINGYKLTGDIPEDTLQEIINKFIKS